jgi:hypothetical protein
MKKKVFRILCLLMIGFPLFPQPQWVRTYGGSEVETANSVQSTKDGGFIVAGFTGLSINLWLLRLLDSGEIGWSYTYSLNSPEQASDAQQTPDGGYIVTAWTWGRIWILKLFASGLCEWQYLYYWNGDCGISGNCNMSVPSLQQTADDGFIVAATVGLPGLGYWAVFKLNSKGQIEWQSAYKSSEGGAQTGRIRQTRDRGFVVTGSAPNGLTVLKLSESGGIQWQKAYGGMNFMGEYFPILQTRDGGFIVTQGSNMYGAGGIDILVLKLAADGGIEWQRTYGGLEEDFPKSIIQASDGGYLVAGYSSSFGEGGYAKNGWIFKFTGDGAIEWEKVYGDQDTQVNCVDQTLDGGYVAAGDTNMAGSHWCDLLVYKVSGSGNLDLNAGLSGLRAFTINNSRASVTTPQFTAVDAKLAGIKSNISTTPTYISPVPMDVSAFLVKTYHGKRGFIRR